MFARVRPMLGFKRFETAAVAIRGIELAEKIKKGQFQVSGLTGKPMTMPNLWAVALAAYNAGPRVAGSESLGFRGPTGPEGVFPGHAPATVRRGGLYQGARPRGRGRRGPGPICA